MHTRKILVHLKGNENLDYVLQKNSPNIQSNSERSDQSAPSTNVFSASKHCVSLHQLNRVKFLKIRNNKM